MKKEAQSARTEPIFIVMPGLIANITNKKPNTRKKFLVLFVSSLKKIIPPRKINNGVEKLIATTAKWSNSVGNKN